MVIGPPWTRGEIEPPQGRRDMGSWTAAVYTQEQQQRLGVDERGQKIVAAPAACASSGDYIVSNIGSPPAGAPIVAKPMTVASAAPPVVEDMGSWKITKFGYTPDQEARLGADHHCTKCNGLPVVPPTMTPSLSKALLNSPALLKGLCSMYFRRYDTNRNNILELSEVHTLCDDLHIGLGMTMSSFTTESLRASIGRFGRDGADDQLRAEEFPLWFAETLKESIELHQKHEQEIDAQGFLPLTVKSEGAQAKIKVPLDLSMHDITEAVAAVLEMPLTKTCLLHGDTRLPSGQTPLSELGLSEQTELTAIVVN